MTNRKSKTNKLIKLADLRGKVTDIAPWLLGKYLVLEKNGRKKSLLIHEVEAYDGTKDLACHASKGRTKRTAVLFGPAGFWYVYLCYGMYHMLNIVTGPKNYPAAVLIRGAGEWHGPGKLTKSADIDGSFNGKKMSQTTGLWIEDRGEPIMPNEIKKTARIGVSYAGPVWSKKKYRFILIKSKV